VCACVRDKFNGVYKVCKIAMKDLNAALDKVFVYCSAAFPLPFFFEDLTKNAYNIWYVVF
jgi:hypothetical protein